MRCPYEVLGVAREATPEQVRRAYLAGAKALHPDTVQGDHEKFIELKDAYDVLSDPAARAAYDESGRVPRRNPALRAAACVPDLVIDAVRATADVRRTDILAVIREAVAAKLKVNRRELRARLDEASKYAAASKRLKGSEVASRALAEHAAALQREAEPVEFDIETGEEILQIVAALGYETDEAARDTTDAFFFTFPGHPVFIDEAEIRRNILGGRLGPP